MRYAEAADVQSRMTRTMSADERPVCETLLDDAAAIIDAFAKDASVDVKRVVSCRMVVRALGDSGTSGIPAGASQGSMSALGYSQSWTIGSGGGVGELYLSKVEKQMLGKGNRIGSYSPVEDLVWPEVTS